MITIPTEAYIKRAALLLREGKLIGMPTETVYGLAGNAENNLAIAGIFSAKGRPSFNPLIIHVDSVSMAKRYAEWNSIAENLAEKFWPGPLTLVLPRKSNSLLSHLATAGIDSVAIRLPAHPVARAVITAAGVGIAAPSANRSGCISPTLPEHVEEELGEAVAMILDGGPCSVGLESTVVDCTDDTLEILRAGAVTKEMLEKIWARKYENRVAGIENANISIGDDDSIEKQEIPKEIFKKNVFKSPGMLLKHYSPTLPLRINAAHAAQGEIVLAFGNVGEEYRPAKTILNLSEQADLQEAAANLFAMLRVADSPEYEGICVMPIPEHGLGVAINDRLMRAAQQ